MMFVIPGIVLRIVALIVVSIASATDLKSHKIPNKLTFPAALVGIVLQGLYFASWSRANDLPLSFAAGAVNAIIGWFTGVFIMALTKAFMSKFGHGDTKLMGAIGSIVGPGPVLMVYFYYSLCFGFFSLFKMILALPWKQLAMSFELKQAGGDWQGVNMDSLNAIRKEIIPVAPFIALGTLCTFLFEKQTLLFFGFVDLE